MKVSEASEARWEAALEFDGQDWDCVCHDCCGAWIQGEAGHAGECE